MPMPRKYGSVAERQSAYRERCRAREEILADPIPTVPGRKRFRVMFGRALCLVEQAEMEMRGYYDGRSEAWQESEQGESFAEAMESAAEIASLLRDMPPL